MAKPESEAFEAARKLHRATSRLNMVLLATRAKGMSSSRLLLLARLQREGSATASALAAHLRLQPQSMTRLIASMERHGYIARHPDAYDARQMLIEITEEGKLALRRDLGGRRRRLTDAMERTVSESERGVLVFAAELMERIAEAIAPADAPSSKRRAK
jgi:DNA-binding MarR family transcriptional regulator